MTEELYARMMPVFLDEATRMLRELDVAAAELAIAPGDDNARRRLARAVHTLKGNAAMLGLAGIVAAAIAIEDEWPLGTNVRGTNSALKLDAARARLRTLLADVAEDAANLTTR